MSNLCFCINAYIICIRVYASFGRHPLSSVQDIQDWRPKRISRIFGNQDWKKTRWDTRMNSANPDIANFERSQVRRRGAQRRTKHPNIKYHHWREEVRKEIISISIYHTGTKWQKKKQISPSQTFWQMFEGKRWWRIDIRINMEQNTLLHWNEGVWVYVHTRSARKGPLKNPRGIHADQRGQHVRRRPLTRGQPYIARPLLCWGENTARDNALSSQLPERTTTEGTMPLEP